MYSRRRPDNSNSPDVYRVFCTGSIGGGRNGGLHWPPCVWPARIQPSKPAHPGRSTVSGLWLRTIVGRAGEVAALPLIARALTLCHLKDRPFIVLAVKRIGDAAIQVVVESLTAKEPAIRENAVAVFENLGALAGPALVGLQRAAHSTARNRLAAREALAVLEHSPLLATAMAACNAPQEIDRLVNIFQPRAVIRHLPVTE